MTDTSATPEPKKITRQRPTNFPRQIIIMASDDLADALIETAAAEKASRSEVARRWMEAGREYEAHLEGREV